VGAKGAEERRGDGGDVRSGGAVCKPERGAARWQPRGQAQDNGCRLVVITRWFVSRQHWGWYGMVWYVDEGTGL
jgi:hypothetical protein